jgi:hypothetical protein
MVETGQSRHFALRKTAGLFGVSDEPSYGTLLPGAVAVHHIDCVANSANEQSASNNRQYHNPNGRFLESKVPIESSIWKNVLCFTA